jgi:hypothetical protein
MVLKKESKACKEEEEEHHGDDLVKLKPYVWKSMTPYEEFATKLAACLLLSRMYGDDVNMVELHHKHKIRFNKQFRNGVLFLTLPKFDSRWRNHGPK